MVQRRTDLVGYIEEARREQRVVSFKVCSFSSALAAEVSQQEDAPIRRRYRLIWRRAGENPGPMEFTKSNSQQRQQTTLTWLDWGYTR
jgi:hypothetical protein